MDKQPNDLRVLFDAAADGVTNMASDAALLDAVGLRTSPPTLRIYQWSPPTISLGYFQAYAEYEALPPPAGELAVVRRTTGGGAILHDRELTYSLTLPTDHPLLTGGPAKLYAIVHDALIAAIAPNAAAHRVGEAAADDRAQRGPFFCFERRHRDDVVAGGEKLIGSAQRRTRVAVLQHGSLMLDRRFDQQRTAVLGVDAEAAAALGPRIVAAVANAAGLRALPGAWTDAELASADAFRATYGSDAWARRR